MRRMQKENLRRFDGRPLFPERRAYTVNYPLSPGERALYDEVTDYVRNEFNRAEKLQSDRRGTVGFALTVLQRRLASSPEAIYQSLKRRRERLEKRLEEVRQIQRGQAPAARWSDDGACHPLRRFLLGGFRRGHGRGSGRTGRTGSRSRHRGADGRRTAG